MPGKVVCFFGLLCLASLQLAHATNDEGAAFLADNAEEDGVIVLPSGLQYKVLEEATDPDAAKPKKNDSAVCHYTGTTIDGTVFDSSRERGKPATFGVTQVIAGWTEALQLMRVGERWQLFIPSELAYGEKGAGGNIGPGAALIFDLELLSIAEASKFFTEIHPTLSFLDGLQSWQWMLFAFSMFYMLKSKLGGGGDGRKVDASHILVKEESVCIDLKKQLDEEAKKGNAEMLALFKEMAGKQSTCPSGKSGGSLGSFSAGQMVPAFDKVSWSAPVGVVQGPVKTQFGYHLILVTRRDPVAAAGSDKKD